MAIPTYTPGYPPDGSSLGQTKATIRNNLDGTFQTLAVDHIDNNGQPGSKPAGYHNLIHMVPQASTPAPVTNYSLLYSKFVTPTGGTADTQLFHESSSGVITQLTGPNAVSAVTNGYAWLPGPILVQWGSAAFTSSNQSVDLNIDFPNNFFNIQITPSSTSTGTSRNIVATFSVSQPLHRFTVKSINYTSSDSFFWFAIGN